MEENMQTLEQAQKEVEDSAGSVQQSIDQIVAEYGGELDSIMQDLFVALTGKDAIDTNVAERYYAELTNLLYFMADKVEKLNVYSDISKASAKEKYNKYYMAACADKDEKGKSIRTVAENSAKAELLATYNTAVSSIYEHAYKTLRDKVAAATEMVSTLKNILKHRAQEEYLSSSVIMRADVVSEALDEKDV